MSDIIDINVYETSEDVTINVTESIIEVNINQVNSGSVGMWGSIIGDIADQTDLQNALDLKANVVDVVPYNGATQDVNLGEFGLQTGNIEFDLTPTAAPTTVGSMSWNDQAGTVDLKLKGGAVTLQIGQETVARVVNKTATNITLLESNYQAVRVTGAIGQRPKVDLALANNDLNSTTTLGLVTETILNNQEGFITTSGQVQQINTTGSLQGETWADGDVLYLSGTIAGQITNIKPIAPIHTVILGFVEHAHITQGKIFVKVDNGYELEELHNVSAIAPNNNEVLTYDTASLLWKPKTVSTALGYTPENQANKEDLVLDSSSTKYPTNNLVKTNIDLKEDDLGNPLVDGYVLASTIAGVRSWVEKGSVGGGTWGTITGELSDQVDLQNALDLKVDFIVGKGLSTNDFTDALETKLNGIEAGAEVNVNADWNAISGDAQILNKPSIPTNTSDLTNDGDDGVNPFITAIDISVDSVNSQTGVVVLDADDIDDSLTLNKFVTAADLTTLLNTSGVNTGDQDLSGLAPISSATFTGTVTTPAIVVSSETADTIASFDVSKNIKSLPVATYPDLTELTYVKGVTSAIQTQLGARQPLDATLIALAAYNTNGILTQIAADTFTGRTITGTANRVTVTNGDGVAGNPTLTLPQDIHTAAAPQFARLGLGAAANLASYLNVIANTATVGQIYFPPSAVDYTGTLSGMLWNNTSEWKFYDGVLSSVNRLLKLNGNTALANANALNVVTSTGTGGNLGTLKAEVAFSRYPTAISYTVLLTDVGFGWIIAVTSTAAARTITLPPANTVTAGFPLTVKDESGGALTNNITISRAGADTIDGATSNVINLNYGSRTVYSDGVSKWFII